MGDTIFVELRFWLLVLFSLVAPPAIYAVLARTRRIGRAAVLALGLSLVVIAGIDVYLLQWLQATARRTPSLADDVLFTSEVGVALYVFPLFFGGVGVNVVSHLLIAHLLAAERREQRHRRRHERGADATS